MRSAVDAILQTLHNAAMKLTPHDMRALAGDLEDTADELRMVATDVERQHANDEKDRADFPDPS